MKSNYMTLIYSNCSGVVNVEIKNRYSNNKVFGSGKDESALRVELESELKQLDDHDKGAGNG